VHHYKLDTTLYDTLYDTFIFCTHYGNLNIQWNVGQSHGPMSNRSAVHNMHVMCHVLEPNHSRGIKTECKLRMQSLLQVLALVPTEKLQFWAIRSQIS